MVLLSMFFVWLMDVAEKLSVPLIHPRTILLLWFVAVLGQTETAKKGMDTREVVEVAKVRLLDFVCKIILVFFLAFFLPIT